MNKYKYTGEYPVGVPGVGEVQPNQVVKTEKEINNPNFIKITDEVRNESAKPDFAKTNRPVGIKNK